MIPERRGDYRPYIDGLRAISILAVVGYHIGLPGFSGGFVGVDVFFVISGFIMYAAARDEPPLEFVRRRLVRVVPLYWMATLALAVVSIVVAEVRRARRARHPTG